MSSEKPTGHEEETRRFRLRDAEQEAAFFLPHLSPGMRLLDAGCGPGSITRGLANYVAPGDVTGIDSDAARIETALGILALEESDNLSYEVADVTDLPFENGQFDAVFANGLIEHLPFPGDGISELMRVLKPGGIIGLRSPDWDVALLHPDNTDLRDSIALRNRWQRSRGGHPDAGRMLRGQLKSAGFADVVAGSTADSHGTDEGVAEGVRYMHSILNDPELSEFAEANGWASDVDLDRMRDGWTNWSEQPDAFASFFWCHAIGRKP
ncbi:MAG: methyltransferase domain-containing protein [Chloroflexi bacterium]|nr:methyltransferase domain-containing protein [Chloroflexota bacterium]